MNNPRSAIWPALAAAALFGGSTPLVKLLVGELPTLLLAGLLYLGSGLGLAAIRLLRDRCWKPIGLATGEWHWLAGAIVFGGLLGPVLLVFGLTHTAAGAASLMLNLEAVFTAVLAWVIFKENADLRIVLGMLLIVAGGAVLVWPGAGSESPDWIGPLAIAAACLCWAIDNNLTRKVALNDATWIASVKGLSAGSVNLLLALWSGSALPPAALLASGMALGLVAYGISLVLFVIGLRHLGTARTGAYFSVAPFFGAILAVTWLGEPITAALLVAGALMALGLWLHLSETHEHGHTHEAIKHAHEHEHDAHHAHTHVEGDVAPRHSHTHRHEVLRHSHGHFPDAHHRHSH